MLKRSVNHPFRPVEHNRLVGYHCARYVVLEADLQRGGKFQCDFMAVSCGLIYARDNHFGTTTTSYINLGGSYTDVS